MVGDDTVGGIVHAPVVPVGPLRLQLSAVDARGRERVDYRRGIAAAPALARVDAA